MKQSVSVSFCFFISDKNDISVYTRFSYVFGNLFTIIRMIRHNYVNRIVFVQFKTDVSGNKYLEKSVADNENVTVFAFLNILHHATLNCYSDTSENRKITPINY